jgi:hypothetical protein
MLTVALRLAGAAFALAALSGCVSQGPIAGQLEIPGQPPERVTFTYATDRFDDSGTLSVMLPSGERFTGRYAQLTSATAADISGPTWAGFAPLWADWGPYGGTWWGGPEDVWTFGRNYSGRVVATLFGERGDMIRCRFKLVNPPGGMSDGGTGECQLSTGGTINAQF